MKRHTLADVRSRRRGQHRLGAAAVEFAAVAPVFILLVFGMIEFGRAVMLQHAMTDAARAGCRKAVLVTTRSADDATSTAHEYLSVAASDSSDCRVTITPGDLSTIERGTEITMMVEADYSDLSWVIPGFMGEIVLRGESTMLRE